MHLGTVVTGDRMQVLSAGFIGAMVSVNIPCADSMSHDFRLLASSPRKGWVTGTFDTPSRSRQIFSANQL
jgi:hypothetical protein